MVWFFLLFKDTPFSLHSSFHHGQNTRHLLLSLVRSNASSSSPILPQLPSYNRYENRYELQNPRGFPKEREPAQHNAPTKPFSTGWVTYPKNFHASCSSLL